MGDIQGIEPERMTALELSNARYRLGLSVRQFSRLCNLSSSRHARAMLDGKRPISGPIVPFVRLVLGLSPSVTEALLMRARCRER